ncbi:MAG: serine dehydrogenasease [bacterium]|nr:serine dehydrogenasease [bacterium]MCY3889127.1 serine dehydrogenasease [bacterium]
MTDSLAPPNVGDSAREWANARLADIEAMMDADGLTIISPMQDGVEHSIKIAIEGRESRRANLFVVLDTTGGAVEVVERIVRVLRKHYEGVKFIIPNRAMSAGTVLAMSGDEIWMDYHSCLGPIDPQLFVEGHWVPALSYLEQYERLIEKSQQGGLSSAELVLLGKLDLAALHRYELARNLSVELLQRWLAAHKFKDWTVTEGGSTPVTQAMKEDRASEIASALSDHTRWRTHARGIDIEVLRELKLRIEDLDDDPNLKKAVWDYFWFMCSYMTSNGSHSFVHSLNFF